jgi:predicted RNase H-like HicB family nuclease
MENRFTAIFQRDGDGWVAWVEELPGANTQGDTLDEARENLKEAVTMILEANRELAERELAGKEVVKEELLVKTP